MTGFVSGDADRAGAKRIIKLSGIDTSTLKQQRANVMNITVSGGQPSFGAVVQGAMNKVAAPAQQGT